LDELYCKKIGSADKKLLHFSQKHFREITIFSPSLTRHSSGTGKPFGKLKTFLKHTTKILKKKKRPKNLDSKTIFLKVIVKV
jgi:hypothetical protein